MYSERHCDGRRNIRCTCKHLVKGRKRIYKEFCRFLDSRGGVDIWRGYSYRNRSTLKTEYRSTVGDMADNRKNTVAGTAHCDNVVQGSTGTATVTRTVQSTRHEVFTKNLGQNRSKSPHSTVRGNVSSVEMARDTMSREKYIFKSYRPKTQKCYPKKVEGHFAEAP